MSVRSIEPLQVHPWGVEPQSLEPESNILSIELRMQIFLADAKVQKNFQLRIMNYEKGWQTLSNS